MKKNKFNIGDRVYHVTANSPKGIILDCRYSLRYNEWEYLMTFDYGRESLLYNEDELTFDKVVV